MVRKSGRETSCVPEAPILFWTFGAITAGSSGERKGSRLDFIISSSWWTHAAELLSGSGQLSTVLFLKEKCSPAGSRFEGLWTPPEEGNMVFPPSVLFPVCSTLGLSWWFFEGPLCPATSTLRRRQSWPWWCIGFAVDEQKYEKPLIQDTQLLVNNKTRQLLDTYRYNNSFLPVWTPSPGWKGWIAGISRRTSPEREERRAASTPNGAGRRSAACTPRSPPSPPCRAHSARRRATTPRLGRSGGRWCPGSRWCAPPPCIHPTGSCRETGRGRRLLTSVITRHAGVFYIYL